jgi:long-chain acyl-CoA synthetase
VATGFFHIAEERPDGLAVVDAHRKLTWAEFDGRVNRLARVLRDAGLQPGDHMAMIMGNRSEFMEVLGACLKTGVVVTPVNWHFQPDEAAYVVENCDARALIVDEAYLGAGRRCAEVPGLRLALTTGAGAEGLDPYESFLAEQDPSPLPLDVEPGGFMLYTSGTTGRPKGVHRSLAPPGATLDTLLTIMGMMGAPLGIQPGGAHLLTGPLYHAAPLGFGSMSFNAGNTLVMMDHWTPEATLDLIEEWSITDTHMVPTMFVRLLRLPEERKASFDTSTLRAVVHGAAPCPIWVKEAMIDWWGPVLNEYYGATEGGITIIGSDEWQAHKGSVGKPLPLYSVEIRDDDGKEVPTGEVGTVWFRSLMSDQTFSYYKDEEKTRGAHLEPGVFTLGDVGRVDDDGYLFLTDRKSDLIISGGVNIYPAEVEKVLGQHPAVADVAVFGIPHEEWGEEVKAAVELIAGHEPSDDLAADLIGFCRDRLAHYKCPRSVDFEDELPRHPTGKLYKRLLRDRYWSGRGSMI